MATRSPNAVARRAAAAIRASRLVGRDLPRAANVRRHFVAPVDAAGARGAGESA